MRKYRITTGSLNLTVEANSREEAIQNFFKMLKVFWHNWRDKIGQIAIVHDRGKEIAFRLVPSLYNMGLLDEETAITNLLRVFEEKPTPEAIREARIILYVLADEDKWMTKEASEK